MNDLNPGQEKIAERLAKLLADSPMDSGIKQELLDNLDRMPMHHLVKLMGVLVDQQKGLSALEDDVNALVKQHEGEWKALEKQQDATAMSLVDAAVDVATAEGELEEDLAKLTE